MTGILMSIRPDPCRLILSGEKTIECRKTIPSKEKTELPFKVYLYETLGNEFFGNQEYHTHTKGNGAGMVVGEFTCVGFCWVLDYPEKFARHPLFYTKALRDARISQEEIEAYGNGKPVYGWIVKNAKRYEEPKHINVFRKPCINVLYCEGCAMFDTYHEVCGNAALALKRPPQSWCYVEVQE